MMNLYKDSAVVSTRQKAKKPPLGHRLLGVSSAADAYKSSADAPTTAVRQTSRPVPIPTSSADVIATSATPRHKPSISNISITTASVPPSILETTEEAPTVTSRTDSFSVASSGDTSKEKGKRKFGALKRAFGGSSSAARSSVSSAGSSSALHLAGPHQSDDISKATPPAQHATWQIEQFLSAHGQDLGGRSEGEALTFLLGWVGDELKKRGQDAKKWEQRFEDLAGSSSSTTLADNYTHQPPPSVNAVGLTPAPSQQTSVKAAWAKADDLESQLEDALDQLAKSKAQNQQAEQKISSLEAEVAEFSDLKAKHAKLEIKHKEANHGWHQNYDEKEKLAVQVVELQDKQRSLEQQTAHAIKEAQDAKTAQAKAEAKATSAQQSLKAKDSAHQFELNKLKDKSQVARLQTRVNQLSVDIAKAKAAVGPLEQENRALEAKKREVELQLDRAQQERDKAQADHKTEQQLNQQLKVKVDSLQPSKDKLERDLKNEQTKMANATIELQSVNAELAKSKMEIVGKENTIIRHSKTIHQLTTEKETLEASLGEAKRKLSTTVAGLEAQKSQKYTGWPKAMRDRLPEVDNVYEDLMWKAKQLNALRKALEAHSQSRTNSLLVALGIEKAVGADYEVPDDLIDVVEVLSPGSYELTFPLTSLRGLERSARGVPAEARLLLVRVSFADESPEFCVHLYPQTSNNSSSSSSASKSPNNGKASVHFPYRYPAGSATASPQVPLCSTSSDRLTFQVWMLLQSLLSGGPIALDTLYAKVQTVITGPGNTCLICAKPTGIKLWRPTTCDTSCGTVLSRAPLAVQLPEIMSDLPVLDLLLTSVAAAVAENSALDLLPNCPVPKRSLQNIFDSFPAITSPRVVHDLLVDGSGSSGPLAADRMRFTRWVMENFTGFMMSAPENMKVPSMPGAHQFILLNGALHQEKEFRHQLHVSTQAGSSSSSDGGGGVAFHGTRPSRLYRILTEGLKVMSNTPFMAYGAAKGAGIYLATNPQQSMNYATGTTGNSWLNSNLKHMRVLLGCEVAGLPHASNKIHVAKVGMSVAVRYVFLVPNNFQAPIPGHVEPAMRSAYAVMRKGRG